MTEIKAISPVASDSDLNKNVKDASSVAVIESSPGNPAKTSFWRKVVGLVWDSVEGDPEYRKYVQRLDTFFLYGLTIFILPAIFPLSKPSMLSELTALSTFSPTVCFGYFIKYLDQTNYSRY